MKTKSQKKTVAARRKTDASGAQPGVRKILVTTDFSRQSLTAVRYALALGGKIGAAVTLLHVIEQASPFSGMEAVATVRPDSEITALVRAKLEALGRRESRGGAEMKILVREGKPFHEITLAASELEADLIIIATQGHTGLKRVLLGSTAERVVRHAPCPVLTVPAGGPPTRARRAPPLRLGKILVPTDFSGISKDALPYATLLAHEFDAGLTLLHVVQTFPIDRLWNAEIARQTLGPMVSQAKTGLELLAAEIGKSTGVRTAVVASKGTPYQVICDKAGSLGAGLIVVTTHGYTGLKHVWLGSTAERVVRHAPCPVLVVRQRSRKR